MFDADRLIFSIKQSCLASDFCSVIAGYFCTKKYFQATRPERKPKEGGAGCSLGALAKDFCTLSNSTSRFHDAVYDVEVLMNLFNNTITRKEALDGAESFFSRLMYEKNVSSYEPLKEILSKDLIDRLIALGINYNRLKEISSEDKENMLSVIDKFFKSKDSNNKCYVTNRSKTINGVVDHFKNL